MKVRLIKWTPPKLANTIGVSVQSIINWIKAGYLKTGLTPKGHYLLYKEDIRDFLKKFDMKIPEELNV